MGSQKLVEIKSLETNFCDEINYPKVEFNLIHRIKIIFIVPRTFS